MTLVSVIIPVHKTIPYFKDCVQSVLTQKYTNLEIIIVCNGTLKIDSCKFFLSINDPRIHYIQSDQGRHNARNAGMIFAKGEFIQFLDYDDVIFPEKILLHMNYLNALSDSHRVITISKWEMYLEKKKASIKLDLTPLFKMQHITGFKLYKILGENNLYIMTAAWLFPKNLIDKVSWEDVPNDDALFASEIIKKESRICMIPRLLSKWRIHDNNTFTIRSKHELDKLIYSWGKISNNLSSMNHPLIHRYVMNANFYMLNYSLSIKAFRFYKIIITYSSLALKSDLSFRAYIYNYYGILKKIVMLGYYSVKNKFSKLLYH